MTSSQPLQPSWRRLPITTHSAPPRPILFFTFHSHAQGGLELHVSDLVHLWSAAQTSRPALHAEAARSRCPIDPSEDADQHEVLVAKLKDALFGRDGAEVRAVLVAGDAGADVDGDDDDEASMLSRFDIVTSMPLPASLGLLKWTFRMVRQGPAGLARRLVLPALRVVEASRGREEQLRRAIREKDHVIGRLIDRIEGAGMDLAMVFPGLVGARKGLHGRLAEELVPGIRAFRGDGEMGDGDFGGGLKEVLDSLKDPEIEKLVLKGLDSLGSGLDDEQQLLGKHEFGLRTNERDQVKMILLLVEKSWLISSSNDMPINLPSQRMIWILPWLPWDNLEHSASRTHQVHRLPTLARQTPLRSRKSRN
jgi:XLF-Cernunnos, XRcc4-like factor, NHEJ component